MTDLRLTVDDRDLEAAWTDDAPEAASPVNVIARADDVSALAGLEGGVRIRLEATEDDRH